MSSVKAEILLEIAKAAGNLIAPMQEGICPEIDKGGGDFSTKADIASQELIISELETRFPTISIVAEEDRFGKFAPSTCFVIDPLDGTFGFADGFSFWGVTIGYIENGKVQCGVVYFPKLEVELAVNRGEGLTLNGARLAKRRLDNPERLRMSFDLAYSTTPEMLDKIIRPLVPEQISTIRSFGCSVYAYLLLLGGQIDVYVNASCKVWDLAATSLALEEWGGCICDFKGEPLNMGVVAKNCVAAPNMEIMQRLVKLTREVN